MHAGRAAPLVGGVMFAAACASRSAPAPAPVEPPMQAEESREGRTAARILSSPPEPTKTEDVEITVVPAYVGAANDLPVYPPDALRSGCREGRVAVRVHIGTSGRVVEQTAIPDRPVPEDACHQAFHEAVSRAVSRWTFFPAMRRTCNSRRSGDPECTEVPIRIYVDVEFLFEVVEGKGVVRSH